MMLLQYPLVYRGLCACLMHYVGASELVCLLLVVRRCIRACALVLCIARVSRRVHNPVDTDGLHFRAVFDIFVHPYAQLLHC
jgi:hypothetical protein